VVLGVRPLKVADSLVAVVPVGDDGDAVTDVAPTQFVRLEEVE
jgi:hypothetical protein